MLQTENTSQKSRVWDIIVYFKNAKSAERRKPMTSSQEQIWDIYLRFNLNKI